MKISLGLDQHLWVVDKERSYLGKEGGVMWLCSFPPRDTIPPFHITPQPFSSPINSIWQQRGKDACINYVVAGIIPKISVAQNKARSGHPPVFINNILLKHSHTISLHIVYGCFPIRMKRMSRGDRKHWLTRLIIFTTLLFTDKTCWSLF